MDYGEKVKVTLTHNVDRNPNSLVVALLNGIQLATEKSLKARRVQITRRRRYPKRAWWPKQLAGWANAQVTKRYLALLYGTNKRDPLRAKLQHQRLDSTPPIVWYLRITFADFVGHICQNIWIKRKTIFVSRKISLVRLAAWHMSRHNIHVVDRPTSISYPIRSSDREPAS